MSFKEQISFSFLDYAPYICQFLDKKIFPAFSAFGWVHGVHSVLVLVIVFLISCYKIHPETPLKPLVLKVWAIV